MRSEPLPPSGSSALHKSFDCLLERPFAIAVALPWLALSQRGRRSAHGESLRVKTGLDLTPVERHRNRRSRPRARRQRRHGGRGAVIAQIIEINTTSPLLLGHHDQIAVGAVACHLRAY